MVAPKKRKDGMPKKHDQKKREKRGNHISKKIKRQDDSREKPIASRSKSYPFIHPSIHPLIHLHLLIEIA